MSEKNTDPLASAVQKNAGIVIVVFIFTVIAVFCVGMFIGRNLKSQEKFSPIVEHSQIPTVFVSVIDEAFDSTLYTFIGKNRLLVPKSINSISSYDEDSLDLLVGFLDDNACIRLQFTGKKLSRHEVPVKTHAEPLFPDEK